jgi:hypothetical protein
MGIVVIHTGILPIMAGTIILMPITITKMNITMETEGRSDPTLLSQVVRELLPGTILQEIMQEA